MIERRSNELSNFLGMLRSTADSDRSNSSWKVCLLLICFNCYHPILPRFVNFILLGTDSSCHFVGKT